MLIKDFNNDFLELDIITHVTRILIKLGVHFEADDLFYALTTSREDGAGERSFQLSSDSLSNKAKLYDILEEPKNKSIIN